MEHGFTSDYLVLVEALSRTELEALQEKLRANKIAAYSFTEPDLNDELTAIAVHPDGWRFLSDLPLAFRL